MDKYWTLLKVSGDCSMRNYVSKNSTGNVSTYVGTKGELTVDPNTRDVRVHDGVTPGGFSIVGSSNATVDLGNLTVSDQTLSATNDHNMVFGGGTFGHGSITFESAVNGGNISVATISDTWVADYGNIPTNAVDDIFGSSTVIDSDQNIYTIGGDESVRHGYIVKYDTYGNVLWQKYLGLANATGESLALDSTGNVWAILSNYTDSTINVYKVSPSGVLLSQFQVEAADAKSSYGFDIDVDSDNNVLITGHTYTVENLFSNITPTGSSGSPGVILVNSAVFGTEVPTNDGTWIMSGTGITGTATITDVIVGGDLTITINQSVNFDEPGGNWTITHNRLGDISILKIDTATESVAWQWNFGDVYGDDGYAVTCDSANNVIVTGYIPNPLLPLGRRVLAAIKLDTNGNLQWKKTITETNCYLTGQGVTVDPSDNIYITGIRKLAGFGNVDQELVLKLDASGALIWAKVFDATDITVKGLSIAYNSTNTNLYITGLLQGATDSVSVICMDINGNLLWQRILSNSGSPIFQWYMNGHKAIASANDHVVITGFYFDNNANQFTARLHASGIGISSFGKWQYVQGYLGYNTNTSLEVNDLATSPVSVPHSLNVTADTINNYTYENVITYLADPDIGLVSRNIRTNIVQTDELSNKADLMIRSTNNIHIEPTDNIIVHGHMIPFITDTYDIGSPLQRIRTLYAGSNTIYIGNVKISEVNGVFNASTVIVNPDTGQETVTGEAGNKMGFLELTNSAVDPQYLTGNVVAFTHTAYGSEVDVIDTDMSITRGEQQGIYNSAVEPSYQQHTSPANTEWNADGWADLSDVKTRTYTTWRNAVNSNPPGSVGAELIMHDITNNKYWAIKFTEWGENNGGSFAYTRQLIDTSFTFTKIDYGNNVDVITETVHITRGNAQGIFNTVTENGWNQNTSPEGTLWNADGWADLSNLTTRTYTNFYAALGGNLGNNVPGTELIMYIPADELYYTVKFGTWTQGNMGGGFSYVRIPINVNQLDEGIKFADGTTLKSAEGIGRVKSESSGNRRIEEVYGTSLASVTEKVTTVISAAASRSVINENLIWIDINTTTIDDIINNPTTYNVWDQNSFEFSLDNSTWYKWIFSTSSNGDERGYSTTGNFTYNQGDTVYFRYSTGGQPVVWWNSANLPGGSSNFRGAVIDYHAYSGEATWIGTIHIVDDSGDENIAHTEVSSGSTDSENDDLWLVQNEGTISYRRIDGEAKTLKVQWSAKVFYGSEFYD